MTGKRVLQAGGTLEPDRHVYIERPEDREFLELLRSSEYVNLLAPRQMGKSSLMVRANLALREEGVRTAQVDLSPLKSETQSEAWFRGVMSGFVREFGLDLDIGSWWRARSDDTAGQKLQLFFRDCVCGAMPETTSIVIFLDEIDSTISLPFADGLFTAIRGMYNERSLVPSYRRLTFCMIGVATPNELIKDRRTTAYNVGRTLTLRDFEANVDDLSSLASWLATDASLGRAMLDRVLYWTDGQPYLTLKICVAMVKARATSCAAVDRYVEASFRSLEQLRTEIHFEQILKFVEMRLTHGLDSLKLYERILHGDRVRAEASIAQIELELSGLVKRNREGRFVVRNPIYARLFDEYWIKSQKPFQDLVNYRRRALFAVVGFVGSLAAAAYFGFGYTQKSIELKGLERLAAANVKISGDPQRGYYLTLPTDTTQTSFDEVIKIASQQQGQIIGLSAASKFITNIGSISNLPSLQDISITPSGITNISPLNGLPRLSNVNFTNSPISDIAPLENLPELKRLILDATAVRELSPIARLQNLQALFLASTPVEDLSPIGELQNLETLRLNFLKVPATGFGVLVRLTKLKELELRSTRISDFALLSNLVNLQSLVLWETSISDLEPLKGLHNLTKLDLDDTNVSNLSPISDLGKLRMLYLSGTNVVDLSPIRDFTSLFVLAVANTKVFDLTPLAKLTEISRLDVAGTRVTNINVLSRLTELEDLDLSRTEVSDLEPLSGLLKLQNLDLTGTTISSTVIDKLKVALAPPRGSLRDITRGTDKGLYR
jgi:Leucine-rich repeat (LRR) protein